jgi:hypothetical protein
MPTLRKSPRARRCGLIAVLIALVMTGLLGVVAITLDGGMMQDNRRRVQAAADAAALAAGGQLFANYPAVIISNYTITDPGGYAAAAAKASAAANGYNNDGTNSTVTVNIPPKSGPFTGAPGHVEVIITFNQPRYFSTIWGDGALPIKARAVARGRWIGSNDGIIVLDPNVQNALNASGNGTLTVTGGAKVIVDSSDPASAARVTGGGLTTAAEFDITGGANGIFGGNVLTGVPPTPDPLAYLPPPPAPPAGNMTTTSLGNGNHMYTLSPGLFSNLPNFNQGDIIVLQQASANNNGGIFYISQGGFVSTGATIVMDPNTSGGVMIYNNPANNSNSQGISIQGNDLGTVNLSALDSGIYAGILFWQARTASQQLSVSGNGSFNLTGTFYAANANINITGNGDAVVGSQYISRTVTFSGGGNTVINYTDKGTAKMRDIRLVE